MDYDIKIATIEDLDDIHKLIYADVYSFQKKGIKGWKVDYYPKNIIKIILKNKRN